jgi:hypothetical protein
MGGYRSEAQFPGMPSYRHRKRRTRCGVRQGTSGAMASKTAAEAVALPTPRSAVCQAEDGFHGLRGLVHGDE